MLTFRKAEKADVLLYFEWANDETVRKNAINSSRIILEDHVKWFNNKLADPDTIMLVFLDQGKEIGQLRIETEQSCNEAIIDYSVDKNARGKGFGTIILSEGYQYFSGLGKQVSLVGFVKADNIASASAFIKAGYEKQEELTVIKDQVYFKFKKNA